MIVCVVVGGIQVRMTNYRQNITRLLKPLNKARVLLKDGLKTLGPGGHTYGHGGGLPEGPGRGLPEGPRTSRRSSWLPKPSLYNIQSITTTTDEFGYLAIPDHPDKEVTEFYLTDEAKIIITEPTSWVADK